MGVLVFVCAITSYGVASAQSAPAPITTSSPATIMAGFNQCIAAPTAADVAGSAINDVLGDVSNMATMASAVAIKIFWSLFGIEVIWWLISHLGKRRDLDWHALAGGMGFKAAGALFFLSLIQYLGTSGHLQQIFMGFAHIATTIGVLPGSGTQNINLATSTPAAGVQGLWQMGGCLAGMIDNMAGQNLGSNMWQVLEHLGSIIPLILTVVTSLILGLAYFIMGIQLFMTLIESSLIGTAGVFVLGFSGSRWTMTWSQGYIRYIFSTGMKLFAIYIVAMFGAHLGVDIATSLTSATGAGSDNALANFGLQFLLVLKLLGISLLLILMAIRIPSIAGTLITGTPDMGFAEAAAMATAAVGVAAGAAALGAGAAAGAGAAGGGGAAEGSAAAGGSGGTMRSGAGVQQSGAAGSGGSADVAPPSRGSGGSSGGSGGGPNGGEADPPGGTERSGGQHGGSTGESDRDAASRPADAPSIAIADDGAGGGAEERELVGVGVSSGSAQGTSGASVGPASGSASGGSGRGSSGGSGGGSRSGTSRGSAAQQTASSEAPGASETARPAASPSSSGSPSGGGDGDTADGGGDTNDEKAALTEGVKALTAAVRQLGKTNRRPSAGAVLKQFLRDIPHGHHSGAPAPDMKHHTD